MTDEATDSLSRGSNDLSIPESLRIARPAVAETGFPFLDETHSGYSFGGPEAEPLDVFEPADLLPDSRSEPDPLLLETRGVTSHQRELWTKTIVWQQSILSKLFTAGLSHLAGKMTTCHTQESVKRCDGCKKATTFYNRCELFFCPVCAERLSRERATSIEWWTKQIKQPKHVVLTVRNTCDLTKDYVQFLKRQLGKLRRSKVFSAVVGGFYSMEVTNEGRGWHVHFHLLCDARWIDASELSVHWGKLVGQDYAIVKVKDCRGADYLREVTKYAVKGSELAQWKAHDIATFIRSFSGVRFFGVFGSLYGKRTEWAEWIATVREIKPVCACGCSTWKILSPDELEWLEASSAAARPPTRRFAHQQLALDMIVQPKFPR